MKKIVLPMALALVLASSVFVGCSDDAESSDVNATRTGIILKITQ